MSSWRGRVPPPRGSLTPFSSDAVSGLRDPLPPVTVVGSGFSPAYRRLLRLDHCDAYLVFEPSYFFSVFLVLKLFLLCRVGEFPASSDQRSEVLKVGILYRYFIYFIIFLYRYLKADE